MREEIMEETKLCKVCGKTKKLSQFYKDHKMSKGRMSRCKICFNAGKTIYKIVNPRTTGFSSPLDLYLRFPCESDYRKMYELLSNLGYNVCGDIHKQFCDKYNLETIERSSEKEQNLFSKEKLGLC